MGRHRRSAAGRAATGRATGVTDTYSTTTHGYSEQYSSGRIEDYAGSASEEFDDEPYIGGYGVDPQAGRSLTDTYGNLSIVHTDAYGNVSAVQPEPMTLVQEPVTAVSSGLPLVPRQRTGGVAGQPRPTLGRHPEAVAAGPKASHRKPKTVTPVRTGLLGVSAAVALGTAAVASGLIPGAENYSLGGNNSGKVQSTGTLPSGLHTDGGASEAVEERQDSGTSRDAQRTTTPTTTPSQEKTEEPSATPSTKAPSVEEKTTAPKPEPTEEKEKAEAEAEPPKVSLPAQASETAAAAAEVLKLVNEERAKVGCSPLTKSGPLAKLAEAFSDDMAARDFFDHVDPTGADPWDRAAAAGITSLGGENIARGQGTAQAVMDAWMNSPGHKANILNCDFKTLGVGVQFGDGGPWWTQDFGY
ncbi:CAP domain-containing protein [Streptomyces cavernae]|uniref:CAP domain-containing protein n=1 Tax=Streptomyces cavernae TaxID=2259034 RepID=UPI000FEB5E34|nr:CAP domain-containing protein [Streptomyces cavernae]